jgi:RNA recognition motif-containing protein
MVPQRPSPKPTPPPVMTSVTAPMAQVHGAHGEVLPEAMRAQAQQRNLYENIIGPNGEQLTSSDPYNTTVFVGGLSPLIGEETLKSFFAPFGEIHYVKVPVGKHCGFVQFVRKSDAERAIEAMNGYPIGGSRIRLSWGRSQCEQYFFAARPDTNSASSSQSCAGGCSASACQLARELLPSSRRSSCSSSNACSASADRGRPGRDGSEDAMAWTTDFSATCR